MNRKILYVSLGLVFVALVAGLLVWRTRAQNQSERDMRSALVERKDMLVTASASGKIEPRSRVNLAFEGQGKVAEVLVQVEDAVESGEVLARLDSEALVLQMEQYRAALASAEAQLAQLKADSQPEEVAVAEANLRAAEAQVSSAVANLDQLESGAGAAQIAAAEADLASAIAQQDEAEDMHDKTMKCVTFTWMGKERKICPALGVIEEQARYRLQAAEGALTAAQSQYDDLLAGADADQVRASQANVWNAVAQRDAAQSQLDLLLAGATAEQIAAAEARVAQAQAALEQAELSLEDAALSAPFDGVVGVVNVTAGEMAPAGAPAVVLVDESEFHVIVSMDEMDVGRLAEGQKAAVTLDAFPDVEIAGTIEHIAPAAMLRGDVVYYDVHIGLAPADVLVRADMTANATVVVEELADVLTIPTWALRVDSDTGQVYVNQRDGEQIARTDVEIGVRYAGAIQVLDGLSEGEEVILIQESDSGLGEE